MHDPRELFRTSPVAKVALAWAAEQDDLVRFETGVGRHETVVHLRMARHSLEAFQEMRFSHLAFDGLYSTLHRRNFENHIREQLDRMADACRRKLWSPASLPG